MVDFACWIVAEIAHAKSAKPRRGSGRRRGTQRDYRCAKVRRWESGNVGKYESGNLRRCGRPGGVVGWADVAIRNFVVGGRSGGGLVSKPADF
jgi:hypothetical protein